MTGERIRDFRHAAGLTQAELGEKCGIDAANIRKYESGKQNPKIETLQKIADAMGVGVLKLAGQEVTELLMPESKPQEEKQEVKEKIAEKKQARWVKRLQEDGAS